MPCPGCEARQAEIDYLRKQNIDLTDKLMALANPAALAMARGQMPVLQPQVMSSQGPADAVIDGQAMILFDGKYVPLEEYNRVKAKVDQMASGG